jgi:molybdopterin converting factor subunit 1
VNVKLLFFATYREKTGIREEEIHIDDGMRVGDFKDWLIQRHPGLAGTRGSMLVAVDRNFLLDDDVISGSEIAVFPPVSGGTHG